MKIYRMKVSDLIKKLKKLPQDAEVWSNEDGIYHVLKYAELHSKFKQHENSEPKPVVVVGA